MRRRTISWLVCLWLAVLVGAGASYLAPGPWQATSGALAAHAVVNACALGLAELHAPTAGRRRLLPLALLPLFCATHALLVRHAPAPLAFLEAILALSVCAAARLPLLSLHPLAGLLLGLAAVFLGWLVVIALDVTLVVVTGVAPWQIHAPAFPERLDWPSVAALEFGAYSSAKALSSRWEPAADSPAPG